MNAAVNIYMYILYVYHDISSTVAMLHQFDQTVPARNIKVAREDLKIQ